MLFEMTLHGPIDRLRKPKLQSSRNGQLNWGRPQMLFAKTIYRLDVDVDLDFLLYIFCKKKYDEILDDVLHLIVVIWKIFSIYVDNGNI